MAQSNAIRAGRAYVELFADGSKLAAGLRAASVKLKAFGDSVRDMGTKLLGIGTAISTPLLGAAAAYASTGKNLYKMSQRTGMTVEELSALAFAANMSDVEIESLEVGIRRMQKFLVGAADGSKNASEALASLGLNAADMLKLSPSEQIKAIADKLAGIEDPAIRAAMAMQIFGRNGTALLPMMKNGAAGIDVLMQRANELGLVISTEDAAAAKDFSNVLKELWAVIRRGVFAIGAALAPVLKGCAEWIAQVVINITDWIKANPEIVQRVLIAAGVVAGLGAALIALGVAIKLLGVAVSGALMIWKIFTTALSLVGSALAALMTPMGAIIAATALVAGYLIYASGAMGEATNWLGQRFGELRDDAVAAYQGIADALAAGDIGLAVQILWLTLKLEFRKGINWLLEIWYTIWTAIQDVAIQKWYGMLRGLNAGIAILKEAWVYAWSAMKSVYSVIVRDITGIWSMAVHQIAKGILWVQSLFDSNLDYATAAAEEDRKLNEELLAQDDENKKNQKEISDQKQKDLDRIRQSENETNAGLNKEEAEAQEKRKKKFDKEITDLQDKLQKAQKEWKDALNKAAQERKDKESQKPAGVKPPPKVGVALGAAMKKTVEVTGTFNAAAAYGLGYGPRLIERVAKAAEGTEKNTKKIADEIEDGGGEFS